jgi:hypothetical protein
MIEAVPDDFAFFRRTRPGMIAGRELARPCSGTSLRGVRRRKSGGWVSLCIARRVEFYFAHCRITAALEELATPTQTIGIRREDLLDRPRPVLAGLCDFLGLAPSDGDLEDCCSTLFERPTRTRTKVAWPPGMLRDVARRSRAFRFLDGYEFDVE